MCGEIPLCPMVLGKWLWSFPLTTRKLRLKNGKGHCQLKHCGWQKRLKSWRLSSCRAMHIEGANTSRAESGPVMDSEVIETFLFWCSCLTLILSLRGLAERQVSLWAGTQPSEKSQPEFDFFLWGGKEGWLCFLQLRSLAIQELIGNHWFHW